MIHENTRRLWGSIWLFPIILTAVLLLLTVFKINGSSIGVYHTFFYGENSKDPNLMLGKPRAIRSDEWNVNTQITLAQYNDNFSRINKNLGSGADMSVLYDAPYKDWSILFKPQNWSFFVLPFEQAFAFKWWFIAYLLLLSFYFFTLVVIPGRRLLAAGLAIAFLFSPFIQWWYQYSTLAPIYYSLMAGLLFILLMRSRRRAMRYLLTLLLAYVLISFALVLYPPFQIPCAIVIGLFCLGYMVENDLVDKRALLEKFACVLAAILITGLTVLTFIHTRQGVIDTITNTAYPGKRIVESGGFSIPHLLSGNLDFQLLSNPRAAHYAYPAIGATNQSADATFVLLIVFLFIPSLLLLYKTYSDEGKMDWPLAGCNLAFLLFVIWLFVPHLGLFGKVTQLDKVPLIRLTIGLGLVSFIQLVLFIRRLEVLNYVTRKTKIVGAVYAVGVLILLILLGLHVAHAFPGFVGKYRIIAFALPIPVILYSLFIRRFKVAIMVLTGFSLLMGFSVNPIYQGTEILSSNALVNAVHNSSMKKGYRWAVETSYLENFAFMEGSQSLTGVYGYPQLGLWQNTGARQYIYNRYAHVYLNVDRDTNHRQPTSLLLGGEDHFAIITEPCSLFLERQRVEYILTDGLIPDNCVQLEKTIQYPTHPYFIYKLR
jgi:hypothetical protein